MTIYFYSPDENPYGCFSNFSRHGFELDNCWWPTSEHYFQAQKFVGTPFLEKVRLASHPAEAAKLGRDRTQPLRPDWEQVKDEVMLCALRQKFTFHSDIHAILLNTCSETLVENAPNDYYWGCGKDGSGKNMLGQLLMKLRAEILHSGSSLSR